MAGTEWGDTLAKFGIGDIQKDGITEDQLLNVAEDVIKDKSNAEVIGKAAPEMSDLNLKELNELDVDDFADDDDVRAFDAYRKARLAEMVEMKQKEVFGRVYEVSKVDYVEQVTKASEKCKVVLHVYRDSIPQCKILNYHLNELAHQFKATKFCKGEADVTIPNYPDSSLPSIFIYDDGKMVKNVVGAHMFAGTGIMRKFNELLVDCGVMTQDDLTDWESRHVSEKNKNEESDDDDE